MANTHRRRRYAAPVGGLFLLLAAIGLITVLVSSVRLTYRVFDNSPELAKIQATITPVVMWDPVPFEDPDDVDPEQMLYFSIWAAALTEGRRDYAIDDDSGGTIIPASDLEVAAARLFGREAELQHKTFGEYESVYYYDAARNVYLVPPLTLYVYSPTVDSIEKRDDLYYCRVGYMAPTSAYTINYQGNLAEPVPEKYMLYLMRKNGSSYELVAVRYDEQTSMVSESE